MVSFVFCRTQHYQQDGTVSRPPILKLYFSNKLKTSAFFSRTTVILNTHYHKNFYTYVNNFRIDYCKALLKNPKKQHLSIEGIAFEGGFGSKSTFNTLFKKQTGMTPTQFKNTKK
jgi:AraC-like DNA-binding protein